MSHEDIQVTIVMATYMGARFVREQIQSIQQQTHTNWRLVVRDDESSDGTVKIVEEMAAADPRIGILADGKGKLGPCQNFNELLMASAHERYVMCCDQDDIWLDRKIETTLRHMVTAEARSPGAAILVFTDFTMVDRDGRTLCSSSVVIGNIRKMPRFDLHSLLGYDYIWGCTTMVNRELLRLALPVSTQAESHDYWLALVAATLGEIVFVDEQTMLYRRHGLAVTGAADIGSWRKRFRRHVLAAHEHSQSIARTERHMIALNDFLVSKGHEDPLLQAYVKALLSKRAAKVRELRRLKIRRQGPGRELMHYLHILSQR